MDRHELYVKIYLTDSNTTLTKLVVSRRFTGTDYSPKPIL